jgi:hypothetical protein
MPIKIIFTYCHANMKKLILVFILCSSTATANGQNMASTNLKWEADQTTDMQANVTKPYVGYFKTLSTQSVEWVQKGGQLMATYTVVSVEGTWADVNSIGSVVYVLTRSGKTVRMKFEKTAAGRFVTMIFPANGNAEIKFRISSVAAL